MADSLAEKYFFERERQFGRDWSCKERRSGGFLWTLTYTCSGVSLSVTGPTPFKASMPQAQINYFIFRPLTAELAVQSPLNVAIPSRATQIDADWKSLIVKASVSISGTRALHANGEVIQLKTADGVADQTYSLRTLLATVTLDARPKDSNIAFIDLAASDISAPGLNRTLGDEARADLASAISVSQADFLLRGPASSRLEVWRDKSGTLSLTSLKFTHGRLAVEAQGELGIDLLRRPVGQIRGQATGLSSLFQILGLPVGGSRASGLVGGLFRKPANTPAPDAEPSGKMVPFAFSMKDGALWLGPIRTPVALRPLF